MYISVMKEDKVQKSFYMPSREFEERVNKRINDLGFNGFSAYINHLIANDIQIHSQDDLKVIQRTYKATIRMYKDFSFSLQDAKEYARNICLLQFEKKFEEFIKKLD